MIRSLTERSHVIILSLVVAFVLLSLGSYSQDEHSAVDSHDKHVDEKFDAGSFIFDHIGDSFEWHIATFGDFHLSLPLPIILISDNSGFNVFMSNKFHHGHESYNGFSIAQDGVNKGKIVEFVEATGETVLPLNFSITKNVLALFISLIILVWVFLSVAKSYKVREGKAPKGLQSFLEPLIIFIRDDVAKASIGEKNYAKFMPYLLTIFFFIFLNNLMGLVPLIPGGANLTGNIAITLALSLITFFITMFNGNKNYYSHIFWPPVPHGLKIIMVPIEIIGVFIKPFVLMVRLFANITAGHIIALGFISLIFIFGEMHVLAGYGISAVSIPFIIFMTFLEFLVAFIQAYVFTLLSALYFGMAMEENH